jgi:glycine cleavage system H protein
MPEFSGNILKFRHGRFSARFPSRYLYTMSHFWLCEEVPGTWRIGLTPFATRMLGDIVEFDFAHETGSRVKLGEALGWIEGLKAVSDLFSVAEGEFLGSNPAVVDDPGLIRLDPHGGGWLYSVRGKPDPRAVNVEAYASFLTESIDKMLSGSCPAPEEDLT